MSEASDRFSHAVLFIETAYKMEDLYFECQVEDSIRTRSRAMQFSAECESTAPDMTDHLHFNVLTFDLIESTE
jgi:hypothetical protein